MSFFNKYKKKPELFYLSCVIFTLTAFPKLSIKIGAMPIYFIDILLIISFYYVSKNKNNYASAKRYSKTILVVLILAIISEMNAFINYYGAPQAIYQIFETAISFSMFYSIYKVASDYESAIIIIKAGVLGIFISVILMIMSSLPISRHFVESTIFSLKNLEPAAEGFIENSEFQDLLSHGARGRSLIGVSNITGPFINVMWALSVFLLSKKDIVGWQKMIVMFVAFLAPVSVIMGYSRGGLIGMLLVAIAITIFGSSKYKMPILISLTIAFIVFNTIGWDSDMFYFERYQSKFDTAIENPYDDSGDRERSMAFVEPFEHFLDNPKFILYGEGVTVRKVWYGPMPEQTDKATHSLFAIAYYSYGMIAASIYVIIVISAYVKMLKNRKIYNKCDKENVIYINSLFAAYLGMLPFILFEHPVVSAPRGAMFFFFITGLIFSTENYKKLQG